MLRSVRQLSFFVTTAESETVSRHQKSVYVSVLSLGSSLSSRRNYYSVFLTLVRTLFGCVINASLCDIIAFNVIPKKCEMYLINPQCHDTMIAHRNFCDIQMELN